MTTHATTTDRDYVISALNYRGGWLSTVAGLRDADYERIDRGAYYRLDGFGHLPPEALDEINGGYDWSHIRDSSDAGYARARAYIEGALEALGVTR